MSRFQDWEFTEWDVITFAGRDGNTLRETVCTKYSELVSMNFLAYKACTKGAKRKFAKENIYDVVKDKGGRFFTKHYEEILEINKKTPKETQNAILKKITQSFRDEDKRRRADGRPVDKVDPRFYI